MAKELALMKANESERVAHSIATGAAHRTLDALRAKDLGRLADKRYLTIRDAIKQIVLDELRK